MKAVRIDDGKAVEVFGSPKSGLVGLFHPDFIATLIDAPDEVSQGWYFIDGAWSATKQEPISALDIKDECRARIYAVANQTAQMNMASFAAAGLLDDAKMTAYTSGLQWVAAMRAKCAELIAAADPSYRDDAAWPPCPAAAAALAAQF